MLIHLWIVAAVWGRILLYEREKGSASWSSLRIKFVPLRPPLSRFVPSHRYWIIDGSFLATFLLEWLWYILQYCYQTGFKNTKLVAFPPKSEEVYNLWWHLSSCFFKFYSHLKNNGNQIVFGKCRHDYRNRIHWIKAKSNCNEFAYMTAIVDTTLL